MQNKNNSRYLIFTLNSKTIDEKTIYHYANNEAEGGFDINPSHYPAKL